MVFIKNTAVSNMNLDRLVYCIIRKILQIKASCQTFGAPAILLSLKLNSNF